MAAAPANEPASTYPEERRDPEDGVFRTLDQLHRHYARIYAPDEIDEYWRTRCQPRSAVERTAQAPDDEEEEEEASRIRFLPTIVKGKPVLVHEGGLKFRVDNSKLNANTAGVVYRKSKDMNDIDPAWEALAAWGTTIEGTDEGDGWVKVKVGASHDWDYNDPFLSHIPSFARDEVTSVPSCTRDEAIGPPPQQSPQWPAMEDPFLAERAKSSKPASVISFPSDPGRIARRVVPGASCRTLVFGPWLIFVAMLLAWSCLQRFSFSASVVISSVFVATCVSLILLSCRNVRSIKNVPTLHMGALCLLATVAGIAFGQEAWINRWRHSFWMKTGRHSFNIAADTPATAMADAALIDFVDKKGIPINGSLVDTEKSVGYNDGHMYCVAPILNPEMAGASYAMVNYWAVGMDCCQNTGSFTCDASRERRGGFAVVMLDLGFPCPGCNAGPFAEAVKKAEYEHGVVSAEGALYVRWMQDSKFAERQYAKAFGMLIFVGVVSFGVFLVLGMWAARHARYGMILGLKQAGATSDAAAGRQRAGVDATPLAAGVTLQEDRMPPPFAGTHSHVSVLGRDHDV